LRAASVSSELRSCKMTTAEMSADHKPFEYFLVLDFESTCQDPEQGPIDQQEIIEFPCLLVRADDLGLVEEFHEYIRPVAKPQLTTFCTELTGITQDMIQDRDIFRDVLPRFVSWYESHDLNTSNATFVTCGHWDLETMLPKQCLYSGLTVPQMLDVGESGEFVNIKLTHQKTMGQYAKEHFVCDERPCGEGSQAPQQWNDQEMKSNLNQRLFNMI